MEQDFTDFSYSPGERIYWCDDPKHTSSSFKPSGGIVMVCACIAASGADSVIFIADGTMMNSEVYRNILPASWQRNASNLIGMNFIMQQGNDPKHSANTTKNVIREKCGKFWPCQDTCQTLTKLNWAAFLKLTFWRGDESEKHPKTNIHYKKPQYCTSLDKHHQMEECNSLLMSVGMMQLLQ